MTSKRLEAADWVVAVALVLFAGFRTPEAGELVWGLAAVLGLPLAVRRRWPMPVLGVTVLVGAVAIVVGMAGDAAIFGIAYALYPVGLSTRARPSALALSGALAGVATAGITAVVFPELSLVAPQAGAESFATTPAAVLLYSATIITGSWVVARAVRARRRHAVQLAELRARQAVVDERLRIARDIHDVVGHSLSLIAMKAAVANHLVESHPEEGRTALGTIERISRSALDDVRTVLGALRDSADAAPGAAEFDRLVEDSRSAGVAVDVVRADLSRVPVSVQTSAYRIVQEALTNVVRHAGRTRCVITLAAEPGVLRVSVVDEGTARHPAGPPGHGLLGMRERVALHGGTVAAGFEPGGGFAVRATLPFVPGVPDE